MKVSELFEAKGPGPNEFMNTKLDWWYNFFMGGSPGAYQRKKHKGDVLPAKLSNRYGEKRPNPPFEKFIKALMAPYLEAFTDGFKKAEEAKAD